MSREAWKSKIPEGEIGSARVDRFYVGGLARLRGALKGETVPADEVTALYINGSLVMSDTPDEYSDHCGLFYAARGDVLVHGLGLGCCLSVLLEKECVSSVTVIEKNPDVIALIGPHFPDAEIIEADAMTWKPPKGKRYGAVWHDIWPSKSADNLKEMHFLHRRYGRRADWQGSWAREEIEWRAA